MEDLRHVMVADHIGELLREGDALRAERQLQAGNHARDANGERPVRARVRVGRWLIGVGAAVAGGSTDPQAGPASRAA